MTSGMPSSIQNWVLPGFQYCRLLLRTSSLLENPRAAAAAPTAALASSEVLDWSATSTSCPVAGAASIPIRHTESRGLVRGEEGGGRCLPGCLGYAGVKGCDHRTGGLETVVPRCHRAGHCGTGHSRLVRGSSRPEEGTVAHELPPARVGVRRYRRPRGPPAEDGTPHRRHRPRQRPVHG